MRYSIDGGYMLIVGECLSSYEGVDLLVEHISSRLYDVKLYRHDSLAFIINFCLRELLNNAVEHGNEFNIYERVKCIFHYTDLAIYILVRDSHDNFCLESSLSEINYGDVQRSRTRGLRTLKMLGFELDYSNGWISAELIIEDGGGET